MYIFSPIIRKLVPAALPNENYHIVFARGLLEKKEGEYYITISCFADRFAPPSTTV